MCYKDVVFIHGTWVEENHQAFNFALEKLVSLQKAILWPPLYRVGTAFSKQHHVVKKKKKCPFNQITLGECPKPRLEGCAVVFSTAYTKPVPWK